MTSHPTDIVQWSILVLTILGDLIPVFPYYGGQLYSHTEPVCVPFVMLTVIFVVCGSCLCTCMHTLYEDTALQYVAEVSIYELHIYVFVLWGVQ